MRQLHRFRPGFTLVELLVVITIIGVLIGAAPAGGTRPRGRRLAERNAPNNLKQLGLALLDNREREPRLPPGLQAVLRFRPGSAERDRHLRRLGIRSHPAVPGTDGRVWPNQHVTKAALDPVNMPPTNAAYSIAISTFLCPSAPGPPTVDYSAELSNSFNNFGINVSFSPGLIFGRTDYAPDAGMMADLPGISINAGASVIAEPPDGPVRTAQITDGMSHTLILEEDAGRPGWYGSHGPANVSSYTGASGTAPQGGGAWADPLNYIATNGSDPNGSGIAAGGGFMGIPVTPWSCGNGCSNDSEIFSFHPGGSNVTFGDGPCSSSSTG